MQTRTHIMTINQYYSVKHTLSVPNYHEICGRIDSSSIIAHPVNFDKDR